MKWQRSCIPSKAECMANARVARTVLLSASPQAPGGEHHVRRRRPDGAAGVQPFQPHSGVPAAVRSSSSRIQRPTSDIFDEFVTLRYTSVTRCRTDIHSRAFPGGGCIFAQIVTQSVTLRNIRHAWGHMTK